ncbi:MAG: HTH-type transcriptional repressor YcgE [Elusimicrobia bacterium ADurb.Bin231]|nr:MAG: HTH-type transcriptional repressor YcgE [Elusimicrobia bacterium ADurb.Bin231]
MELEDKKFYSIGEVERITGVKSHVLRYWESKFRLIRPARRTTGHRKYTQEDVLKIKKIKDLLSVKGYTISGAKKYFIEQNKRSRQQTTLDFGQNPDSGEFLRKIIKELESITEILK